MKSLRVNRQVVGRVGYIPVWTQLKRKLVDWKRSFKMTEHSREKQIHEKHEINVEIFRLKCEIPRLIKDSHIGNRVNEG